MRYSLALRVSLGFLASLTAACGSAPTLGSLGRDALLGAPERQVREELAEPLGAPPVTTHALNAGEYSDWFVGWDMPALGVPFMAATTTFRIP